MNLEKILSLVEILIDEKVSDIKSVQGKRGIRGKAGVDGDNGKDFSFEENLKSITEILNKNKIKFSDLTDDEKDSLRGEDGLRGPRGIQGSAGLDGESFDWDKFKDIIFDRISENKFTFNDLTSEEKLELRGEKGPRGQRGKVGEDGKDGLDGRDGKSVSIEDIVIPEPVKGDRGLRGYKGVRGIDGKDGKDGESVTVEEIEKLIPEPIVGPRGLKGAKGLAGDNGNDGKDFDWNEHSEKIIDHIKENKIKFADYTEDEKDELKGEKGFRGQRGKLGPEGLSAFDLWKAKNKGDESDFLASLMGNTGVPGVAGLNGLNGKDGKDGVNGNDGSYIIDIQLIDTANGFYFLFYFSDGARIKTREIEKPIIQNIIQQIMAGNGGGHRNYLSTNIEYDDQSRVETVRDYVDDNKQNMGRKEIITYTDNFVDYTIKSIWSAEGPTSAAPNRLVSEQKIDMIYTGSFVTDIKVTNL